MKKPWYPRGKNPEGYFPEDNDGLNFNQLPHRLQADWLRETLEKHWAVGTDAYGPTRAYHEHSHNVLLWLLWEQHWSVNP